MHTFLGVPVIVGTRVLGNLYVTDKDRGGFTAADEVGATTIADRAAAAIERLRAR